MFRGLKVHKYCIENSKKVEKKRATKDCVKTQDACREGVKGWS